MSNVISKKYIYEAFEAYRASVIFENGFEKMNISIVENKEYMELADYPYRVCVEQLSRELGFSEEDFRTYENMGGWFARIIGDIVDNEANKSGEEMYNQCLAEIKDAIKEDRFEIYRRKVEE